MTNSPNPYVLSVYTLARLDKLAKDAWEIMNDVCIERFGTTMFECTDEQIDEMNKIIPATWHQLLVERLEEMREMQQLV